MTRRALWDTGGRRSDGCTLKALRATAQRGIKHTEVSESARAQLDNVLVDIGGQTRKERPGGEVAYVDPSGLVG